MRPKPSPYTSRRSSQIYIRAFFLGLHWKNLLWIFVLLAPTFGNAQEVPITIESSLPSVWEARWISAPGIERQGFAVLHFRKEMVLAELPATHMVHVSADNRYQLFVNGQSISRGPARGDLRHWRYETLDLAPFLKVGTNVLAAVVWNFGDHRPLAQMSHETAFLLQGVSTEAGIWNTGASWKVLVNQSISPIPASEFQLHTYLVVGPGEAVDGEVYPWGWEQENFEDSMWLRPVVLEPGYPRGTGTGANWMLVPREIPSMIEAPARFDKVSRVEGISPPTGWELGQSLVIPPHTKCAILLDQGQLITGYPRLALGGGAAANVSLTYAEALFTPTETMSKVGQKGNRNEVAGRVIRGIRDDFKPNGDPEQLYQPLWWRTWRYVQLDVETSEDSLILFDLSSLETRYPLEAVATFTSPKRVLDDIWEVGWRTAQYCAHETYVDCPYYEQLQYVGDTRIQALVTMYVSGDDRLVRKAIRDIGDSRIPEGLTQSRYPCATEQVIPTFSLFWVSMVHDYWMLRDDSAFVAEQLPGVKGVLNWYLSYVQPDGLLGAHPWWNFVDWSWPWSETTRFGGVPPGNDSHSSVLSLQLVYTLKQAAELLDYYGHKEDSKRYRLALQQLRDAALKVYWSREKAMFADTPEKLTFSQHANILAVLTDAIPPYLQQELMEQVLQDSSLTQATFYFRFYLTRALVKAGLGHLYLSELQPWEDMLDLGLSTFAEKPEPSRSDCHAWSASPNYEFLATICGIQPAAPGFRQVLIQPELGSLKSAAGSMPHPLGVIYVAFTRERKSGIRAEIHLPEGLEGQFLYKGRQQLLQSGPNHIAW